jgi:hypothetical protein
MCVRVLRVRVGKTGGGSGSGRARRAPGATACRGRCLPRVPCEATGCSRGAAAAGGRHDSLKQRARLGRRLGGAGARGRLGRPGARRSLRGGRASGRLDSGLRLHGDAAAGGRRGGALHLRDAADNRSDGRASLGCARALTVGPTTVQRRARRCPAPAGAQLRPAGWRLRYVLVQSCIPSEKQGQCAHARARLLTMAILRVLEGANGKGRLL